MRTVGVAERRARLGARQGLAPGCRFDAVATAADALVGLHGSDPATPFLAARARVHGFVPADLEADLYERRVLTKHLGMRRTLFVVGEDLRAVVQAACTDRIAGSERTRLVRMVEEGGITDDGGAWLRAAETEVLAELEGRGPLTGAQLARAVPRIQQKVRVGEGKSWGGEIGVATRVVSQLAAEGRIRRGRPNLWTSSRHRWERTAPRPPDRGPAPLAEPDATAELLRRWLGAFGPATMTDLTWWTGLGVTRVRDAQRALDLAEVDLDGDTGYVLAEDVGPVDDPGPWVALLPSLDPSAMGWKQRHWYVGEHGAAVFDRNGNIGPTVWCDGRIVGGWAQDDHGAVRHRVLEDIGREATRAVEEEAGRLEEWLDGVRVTPRFPTPLAVELRDRDARGDGARRR